MFKTIIYKLLMPLLMGGLFLAWQLGGILGARNLLIAVIAILWIAVVYCLCLVATDKKAPADPLKPPKWLLLLRRGLLGGLVLLMIWYGNFVMAIFLIVGLAVVAITPKDKAQR